MQLSKKLFPFLLAASFLFTSLPVSAHDMAIGASRWCFGKDYVVASIDLNSALMAEIKGITDGPYNLGASSEKQLQQVAADIIQPYINKKLSITVNDKAYPVRVDRLVRNENGIYTIWLNVDNIGFNNPVNAVKIDYRLLFDETNNAHINLAYLYLSDAAPDAVQKIFDYSQPAAQINLDANTHVCQVSVKGAASAPAAKAGAESPVAGASAKGVQEALQRSAAAAPPAGEKGQSA